VTGSGSGTSSSINLVSYSNGVTIGDFSGIDWTFNVSDLFGSCTFVVTGTTNFTYTNSTAILAFTGSGSLITQTTTGSGCAGVFTAGDTVAFTGSYIVSPALTITSP